MNEVIHEFLLETQEHLAQLDLDLIALEKDPRERETLARIFRTFHTIKGTAGFLGLMKLQAVTHSAENLLSRLTNGELFFNAAIASAMLTTVDTIRRMLDSVEKTEQEGEGDYSALIQTLERLKNADMSRRTPQHTMAMPPLGSLEPPKPETPPQARTPSTDIPEVVRPISTPVRFDAPEANEPAEYPQVAASGPAVICDPAAPTPPGPWEVKPVLPDAEPALVNFGAEVGERNGESAPASRADEAGPSDLGVPRPRSTGVSETSIRVDVALLDTLMTLVGELVLTRNQVLQYAGAQKDQAFHEAVQRLNLLTGDMQASVMKTRMQPIGTIWSKFHRVVRDMAVALGKQINFEMSGHDTELDKTIIEAIRDPLIHMVRNAIDHGIESPAERKKRGKPEEGRVILNAFHEGGKVVIEVADDGGGIDPQRVRKKAVQSNLITAEQAAQMSRRELLNLILLPGFSTTDKVSHFSGRGVGMNVVHSNLEMIGGAIDIDTCVGLGTTFKIKIPLTLAIIPALTVISGGDCYAIPQINVQELVRLEGDPSRQGIEFIHGTPVYRLRGDLLPLVHLNHQLEVEPVRRNGALEDAVNIVVLQADDQSFGLIVDAIGDTQEIVVKPLQKLLKGIEIYAGATIMGDGRVALILDVLGLAQRGGVISSARERGSVEKSQVEAESDELPQSVLLFEAPGKRRMAVLLDQVTRLEEFPRASLEMIGNQAVVLYRDGILPLIDVSETLGIAHDDGQGVINGIRWQKDVGDTVQVVVHSWKGRFIGLVIGRVVDIVEDVVLIHQRVRQPCVLATAVVLGKATEILEVDAVIRLANPEFYESRETVAEEV